MSIYTFIPHHVGNKMILDAFDLLFYIQKALNHLPGRGRRIRQETLERYKVNEQIWEKQGTPYIDGQDALTAMKYGRKNIGYAGCGVIALYNLLSFEKQQKCGIRSSDPGKGEEFPAAEEKDSDRFPVLISALEQRGMIRGGEWGTSPRAIVRELTERGIPVETVVKNMNDGTADRVLKEYDSFLMTLYNNGDDIRGMIHTVSITRQEDGSLRIHNADGRSAVSVRADTLDELMKAFPGGRAKAILLAGVGNRREGGMTGRN